MPRYPGGYRRRYEFFMRAWAESHQMTVRQAKKDPAARGYYSESHGRGRFRAARAWANAGVIEYEPATGEWEYTEDYA